MDNLLRVVRRLLWMFIVGFMIAWHNVYYQDERLREEDRIEIVQLKEDEGADGLPID